MQVGKNINFHPIRSLKVLTIIAQSVPSSLPAFRENGFAFQLQSCSRTSSEELTCEFLVKNEQPQRRQIALLEALLVDSQGNTVNDENFMFSNGDTVLTLASNIPIKGRIIFRGVKQGANWSLIELHCFDYNKEETFVGEFRSQ
ncbi:MAG: hypothetical protein J7647_12670 [Cyanobacteria bacterium SBLK]|nr:hypothetical protein [Cyanobacteria bacterium SBLK]